MDTQRCVRCEKDLPLSDFYIDNRRKFKHGSYCKFCTSIVSKNAYLKKLDHYKKVDKDYYSKNSDRITQYYRERDAKLRLEAMHILMDNPECKCGVKDIRVLAIDHINNNGKEDRRKGTLNIYRKIISLGREQATREYQIMCHNCNWLKEYERRNSLSKYL